MNTLPRVFAYLRRYPWMALGTLTCAILSTLTVLVLPAVTSIPVSRYGRCDGQTIARRMI
jgi:hypothetical protein